MEIERQLSFFVHQFPSDAGAGLAGEAKENCATA